MKIPTLALILLLSSGQMVQERILPEAQVTVTVVQIKTIVQRYVEDWSKRNPKYPLWVLLAGPGDSLNIPGATFGTREKPKAGMELPINADLIVINKNMCPKVSWQHSLTSTATLGIGWRIRTTSTKWIQKSQP